MEAMPTEHGTPRALKGKRSFPFLLGQEPLRLSFVIPVWIDTCAERPLTVRETTVEVRLSSVSGTRELEGVVETGALPSGIPEGRIVEAFSFSTLVQLSF